MGKKIIFDESPDQQRKIGIFSYLIYVLLAFLFLRIFYLQIIRGPYFFMRSRENQEQHIVIPAERGEIYDRNFDPSSKTNRPLASNRDSMDIYLIPGSLPLDRILLTVTNLSRLLGFPPEGLVSKISNVIVGRSYLKYDPVLLLNSIDMSKLIRIAENNLLLPGIYWQNNPYRVYPNAGLGSHLIGYVGIINKEELDQLGSDPAYHPNSFIGKYGIEKYYDRELRGRDGENIRIVDAQNRIKETIQSSPPSPGQRLILNMDLRVQKVIEEIMKGETGAMMIANPQTGEILGMVSSPGFDPNLFIRNIDPVEYRRLAESRDFPFLNRCISAKYPPSSTFKIITETAALEEEVVTPYTKFFCDGHFQFEGDDRIFRCWSIHGWVDAVKSIAVSCDTYYYNAGYELGSEKISRYARMFGLGAPSGIDLPGESPGFIPSHAWKRRIFKEAWYDGDTINMSIGQGFLLTTPVQMLNIINAVASGGVIYRPYTVNRILNSFNNQPVRIFKPQILKNISLSQKNLSLIRRGLEAVMSWGTGGIIGRAARVKIIGKTGTAQLYRGTPHAWFIGYTPPDVYKDQYSIVTFIEHGGGGGETAVPLGVAALQALLLNQDASDLKQFFLDRLGAVQYERFLRKKQMEDQQNEDKRFQDIQF